MFKIYFTLYNKYLHTYCTCIDSPVALIRESPTCIIITFSAGLSSTNVISTSLSSSYTVYTLCENLTQSIQKSNETH